MLPFSDVYELMFGITSPQCFADLHVSLSGSVNQAKKISPVLNDLSSSFL